MVVRKPRLRLVEHWYFRPTALFLQHTEVLAYQWITQRLGLGGMNGPLKGPRGHLVRFTIHQLPCFPDLKVAKWHDNFHALSSGASLSQGYTCCRQKIGRLEIVA